jgi:hypothetical protein
VLGKQTSPGYDPDANRTPNLPHKQVEEKKKKKNECMTLFSRRAINTASMDPLSTGTLNNPRVRGEKEIGQV